MPLKKVAIAGFIVAVLVLLLVGGGERIFSVGFYQGLYQQSPYLTVVVFFTIYLLGAACSLPVVGALSVAGGVVFGHAIGFLVSLMAASLGGTLAFLSVRYLIHDWVERRFANHITVINRGIDKDGAFYVFSLRMVPVIPFWLFNLLLGLTSMRTSVFFTATLLGMVPLTLVFTYTGSQLGALESLSISGIFTPGIIFALCLLAVFPFLARAIVNVARRLSGA